MKMFIILAVVVVLGLVGVTAWKNMDDSAAVSPSPTESVTGNPSPVALVDGRYVLDASKSTMAWQGQKKIITTWIDRGTVNLKEGVTVVREGKVTEGNVVVDMTSIGAVSTGRGKDESLLSRHLKSADFFDAEQFPTAEFTLTSLTKDASSPDGYTVAGTLTIKGITHPVTFPATLGVEGATLTMKASVQLDRTKWNVRFGSDKFFDNLGDNVIDDTFTVTFTAVSTRTAQ